MKNILKRAISVLLVMVMVFGSAPLAGFVGLDLPELNLFNTKSEAAEGEKIETIPESDLYYTVDENGNVAITGFSGGVYDGMFKIPSTIGGNSVTTIAEYALSCLMGFDALFIPNSVKTIEAYAFSGAEIPKIYLGEGVETIGEEAFSFICIPFSICVGRNLKSIDSNAFNSDECLLESVYYLGTQEEWNAVEIADGNDALNGKVVCLGKPLGKSNIKSYDLLDSAYDNFVYVGTEVYEMSNGELTDYKVQAGDWLEFRTYIKSDLYVGISNVYSLFDNSFFNVSDVANNTVVNSGNSSVANRVNITANNKAVSDVNQIVNYSGLDETVINSNNAVWLSTTFNLTESNLALDLTNDGWYYSYKVQVNEGLAEGTTASVSSPAELWQSYPGTLVEKNRRPSWVKVSTDYVTTSDSAPSFSSCKPMSTMTYNGTLQYVLIDDMNHEFTISNGEENESFYILKYDSEGYLLSHEAYTVGATVNFESTSDDYAGTVDLLTGQLINNITMPACNIKVRDVSTTETFDMRIHLEGGTIDTSALPDHIIDNGDGTLTVKIPFNSELDKDYMDNIFGYINPKKKAAYSPAFLKPQMA